MANYTRNTLTGSLGPVNSELQKIEQSLQDKLDRNPAVAQTNELRDNLDANSKRIINLGAPSDPNDAVRLQDLQEANNESVLPPQSGQVGEYLRTDGTTAYWDTIDADLSKATYIPTFASLSALSPSAGLVYVCIERANAMYVVQPSGYSALAGDVTFSNGLVGALQVQEEDSVFKFESLTQALSRITRVVGDGETAINTHSFTLLVDQAIINLPLKYSGLGGEDFITLGLNNNSSGIEIKGCVIDATGANNAIRGSRNPNTTIVDNEIFGCSKIGIQITGNTGAVANENLNISGNYVHNTGTDGIQIRSSIKGKVKNNTIEAWGDIEAGTPGLELQEYHDGIEITGNKFINSNGDLFAVESAGDTGLVYNSKISNNTMSGSFNGISGKITNTEISGNVFADGNGNWRSGIEVIGEGNLISNNIIANGAISVASNGDGDGGGAPSANSNKTLVLNNKVTCSIATGRALLMGAIVSTTGTPTIHDVEVKNNFFDLSGGSGTGTRALLIGQYTNVAQLMNVNIQGNTIIGPDGVASTEGIRLISLASGGVVNIKGNTIKDFGKAVSIFDDNLSNVNIRMNDFSQGVVTPISDSSTTTVVVNLDNDI